MVNHLLETSHPLLPPLCDSVSLWPTRLPFSVRSSKFRIPQVFYLPGPPGDPQSFHSFPNSRSGRHLDRQRESELIARACTPARDGALRGKSM